MNREEFRAALKNEVWLVHVNYGLVKAVWARKSWGVYVWQDEHTRLVELVDLHILVELVDLRIATANDLLKEEL